MYILFHVFEFPKAGRRNASAIWFKRTELHYTTFTNFSIAYLGMCRVYTDVDGINSYTMGCPPVGGDNPPCLSTCT